MRNPAHRLLIAGLGAVFFATVGVAQVQPPQPVSPASWPRTIKVDKGTIVLYQPQVISFNDNMLEFRMVVGVTPTGSDRQEIGALDLTCTLDIHQQDRVVIYEDLQIQRLSFPTVQEAADPVRQIIEEQVTNRRYIGSLDRLVSGLQRVKDPLSGAARHDLASAPPKIHVAMVPTALVLIDPPGKSNELARTAFATSEKESP